MQASPTSPKVRHACYFLFLPSPARDKRAKVSGACTGQQRAYFRPLVFLVSPSRQQRSGSVWWMRRRRLASLARSSFAFAQQSTRCAPRSRYAYVLNPSFSHRVRPGPLTATQTMYLRLLLRHTCRYALSRSSAPVPCGSQLTITSTSSVLLAENRGKSAGQELRV